MENSPLSNVRHIGLIVRDIDKAIAHFQSLGIGPFEPLKVIITRREVQGKPVTIDSVKVKVRTAQMGDMQLELIEPDEGKSPWREFLETRGDGIEHLGFFVDDIDRETARMEEKGFKILRRGGFQNGGGNSFIDTSQAVGINMELIQWPDE